MSCYKKIEIVERGLKNIAMKRRDFNFHAHLTGNK